MHKPPAIQQIYPEILPVDRGNGKIPETLESQGLPPLSMPPFPTNKALIKGLLTITVP